jgi:hypothetical protein
MRKYRRGIYLGAKYLSATCFAEEVIRKQLRKNQNHNVNIHGNKAQQITKRLRSQKVCNVGNDA